LLHVFLFWEICLSSGLYWTILLEREVPFAEMPKSHLDGHFRQKSEPDIICREAQTAYGGHSIPGPPNNAKIGLAQSLRSFVAKRHLRQAELSSCTQSFSP
jgi:hypothetical protein